MNANPAMLVSCSALADSALAFAANSHGRLCVLAEANISYPESVYEGETLTVIAEELNVRNRIAT
jgi:acyl-CoA thioesterase